MKLTAYRTGNAPFTIEPAKRERDWMTPFVYRCLPMTIANQMGWVIPCPVDFSVVWHGGAGREAITLSFQEPGYEDWIMSHFGLGIVTFSLPFLFRTEPGYGLIVRGAPNHIIPGIHPLDGYVETDWNNSTFTMNWKVTDADRVIRVSKGHPICTLIPYKLMEIEEFLPDILPIESDPILYKAYQAWAESRSAFNRQTDRKPHEWQKDYFKEMQLPKLHLNPFKEGDSFE